MRDVIFATTNKGKIREVDRLLDGMPFGLKSLSDFFDPLPQIPETGATFEANALQKATWVFDRTGVWTIADDSGLEVDALNGQPGVFSARFSGEGATDLRNTQKLLEMLSGVALEKRTARFVCCATLYRGIDLCSMSRGTCEGHIDFSPAGGGGFGYDPVFVPDGFDTTFGQIDLESKNKISHRGKAFGGLMRMMKEIAAE